MTNAPKAEADTFLEIRLGKWRCYRAGTSAKLLAHVILWGLGLGLIGIMWMFA